VTKLSVVGSDQVLYADRDEVSTATFEVGLTEEPKSFTIGAVSSKKTPVCQ
jgi:hypothetical protein